MVADKQEMTDERLAWHLENWARYIASDSMEYRALGFPAESVGFEPAESVTADSYEIEEDADNMRNAVAMDAIIDSLQPHNKWAVYKSQGLMVTEMRDYEGALEVAHAMIRQLAMKRGLV
jgi:hypothetical protein